MNIKKGVNRITIILAVIAIVPGFIGGWQIYKEKRRVSVKFSAKDYINGKAKIEVGEAITTETLEKLEKLEKLPQGTQLEKSAKPPKWQRAIAGFAGSSVAFLIVFFGINGITRAFLWVVEGFKQEKKARINP